MHAIITSATMRCYQLPNYQQTKDERSTDSCFVPLLGCIRVAECIQLMLNADNIISTTCEKLGVGKRQLEAVSQCVLFALVMWRIVSMVYMFV